MKNYELYGDEDPNKIEAEILQEIGADYYETIQKGKNSINNSEQTASFSRNKKTINVESKNGKLHKEDGYQFLKPAIYQNSKFNINKPKLTDYNITQDMYDYEIKRYQKEKDEINTKLKSNEKRTNNASLFIILFLIIICIIVCSDILRGIFIGLILGSVIIYIIQKINEKTFEKNFKGSLDKVDDSMRESVIIQKYNKYLSDLKDYEVELAKYNKKIQMQKEKYWTDMEGHRFEKEIAALYRSNDFYAKVTKGSCDGGVDIILLKNNIQYYVQCKNHKNPVGPATARDLFGAMNHDGIKNGVIVSPKGFTPGVYKFVKGKKIELIKMEEILEMVDHIK